MKILSVDKVFKEAKNLRRGHKGSVLMMSANDVKWCHVPGSTNMIATAASTSAVVIWDVEAERKTERRKALQGHHRAANSVCWHNVPHGLISASQDGIIHYWDTRTPETPAITFNPRSGAVREVDFNPFYGNYFAAALDDGTVQAWDIRKNNSCERRLTAHDGLVLSVAWHPQDSSILASGGRDGSIKVWDLNVAKRPKLTIQTIGAVGQISWRPKCTYQICSSASVIDFSMQIWDLHRPTVPLVSVPGHADVVTGMIWPQESPGSVITASKDGHIARMRIRDAEFPSQKLHSSPMAWNPTLTGGGEIVSVGQRLNRANPEDLQAQLSDSSSFAAGPLRPSPFVKAEEKIAISTFSGPPLVNGKAFQYMATQYKMSDGSLKELCKWNAAVAKRVSRQDLATIWEVVSMMLDGEENDHKDPAPPPVLSRGVMGISTGDLSKIQTGGSVSPLDKPRSGLLSRRPVRRNLAGALFASSDDDEDEDHAGDEGAGDGEGKRLQLQQQQRSLRKQSASSNTRSIPLSGGAAGSSFGDGGIFSDSDDELNTSRVGNRGLSDDSDSDDPFGEKSTQSQPLDLNALREATSGNKTHSPIRHAANAGVTHPSVFEEMTSVVEAQEERSPSTQSNNASPPNRAPWRSVETVVRSAQSDIGLQEMWDPVVALEGLFTSLLDDGDVQTPFHLALAIGIPRLEKSGIFNDATVKRWCVHYLDLLSSMQLWTVRNRILRNVTWEDVRDLSKKGTTFGVNCPYCNQGLGANAWYCKNCKKIAASCSLCRFPVKGLFSWCQTCGHGGHALEMREWWKSNESRICPEPTCNHKCSSKSSF
jgi:WD40 repeat protein